jgi:hypothetical protein
MPRYLRDLMRRCAAFGAAPWIYAAVALVLAYRYRWFMDDGYVYMRYAANAVNLRIGLVFNRGEFVEGFSSPLWMFLWIVARVLGLGASAFVGVACAACLTVTFALLARSNRILAGEGSSIYLPLAYLAANYGFLTYFTSGMENPLVQLVGAGYVLFVLDPKSKFAAILVAMSPLVRQELVLPLAVVFIFALVTKRRWKLTFISAFLMTVAWVLFRVWYYASLFPNTYYLKDSVSIQRGLSYAFDTFGTYGFSFLVLMSVCALIWIRANKVKTNLYARERAVLLGAGLVSVAYVVKIGGDFFHFRYLSFAFILTTCALTGLVERAFRERIEHITRVALPTASLAIFGLTLSCYPVQLERHPFYPLAQTTSKFVHGIMDAHEHRLRRDLDPAAMNLRVTAGQMNAYQVQNPAIHTERIFYGAWCADAYARYDEFVVHSLGLTEPTLARVDTPSEFAGHKWGLIPLAADLMALRTAPPSSFVREYESRPIEVVVGQGAPRAAVAEGRAAAWIVENISCIEAIERRTFNDHAFVANLRMALEHSCRVRLAARSD